MEFRILKYTGFLMFMLLLSAACTKEVQIDLPGYKEQLVVDGRIETGLPAIVLLSKTSNVYSTTNFESYLNSFVDDAVVVLSDGTNTDTLTKICTDDLPPGLEDVAAGIFGIPAAQLSSLHLCAYISLNMVGEVGKTYTLQILHNGKTYTSSSRIAEPVALDSLYWKPEGNFSDRGLSWAKLSDPANTTDAYCWEVKYSSEATFSRPLIRFLTISFSTVLHLNLAMKTP
jgi:hypothetical protein